MQDENQGSENQAGVQAATTPRPWAAVKGIVPNFFEICPADETGHPIYGKSIAILCNDLRVGANARLITCAVNSFDAMRDALNYASLKLGGINLRGFEEPELGSPEHQCLRIIPGVLDCVRAALDAANE